MKEKREIFKIEFLTIIEDFYKNKLELYNYLQQKLLDKYWIIYDVKIAMLKESTAIRVYAGNTIQQSVATILALLGVCAIVLYFFDDAAGIAGLVKDSAELSLKGVEHLKLSQEDTLALATEIIKFTPTHSN